MLINAVIIILREVLEASLILGVLLALSQHNQISKSWSLKALLLGGLAAVMYAANLAMISALHEGVGQEIVNAVLYVFIFTLILAIVYCLRDKQYLKLAAAAMFGCVVLAVLREGSEIIVYIHGFSTIPDLFTPVLVGSSIGAGIGLSIGVFVYYLIVSLPFIYGVISGFFVLVFIAGGMVSQAIQMLLQADLISSELPIWDTSQLVSEQSIVGQILFAMMGYEATPILLQVVLYTASILLTGFFAIGSIKRTQQGNVL